MSGGAVGIGALRLGLGAFADGSEVARFDLVLSSDGEEPGVEVGLDGMFDLTVTDDDGTELSVWAGLHDGRELVGDLCDWYERVLE
jgi:hypothetical protein